MTGTTRSSEGLDVRRRKALVPLLASRNAGNGFDHGPLRRCHCCAVDAGGTHPSSSNSWKCRTASCWLGSRAKPPCRRITTRRCSVGCAISAIAASVRDRHGARSRRARFGPLAHAGERRRRRRRARCFQQISRVPLRRTRRHAGSETLSSYAATGAHGRTRARSRLLRPGLVIEQFRPGIVCPMTGSRHMRASSPNA